MQLQRLVVRSSAPFVMLFACVVCALLSGCQDKEDGVRTAVRATSPLPAATAPTVATVGATTRVPAAASQLPPTAAEPEALATLAPQSTVPPSSASAGAFAIYLLDRETSPEENRDPSTISLPRQPLLSPDDIINYEQETHLVHLAPGVAGRLDGAELPGKSFVVALGREPRYAGLFMAAYISRSFDGVVILWPSMSTVSGTLQIQLGYPSPDFFVGPDPRSQAGIMDALRQAGKLLDP